MSKVKPQAASTESKVY